MCTNGFGNTYEVKGQKLSQRRSKRQKLDQDSDSGFGGGGVVVRTGTNRSGSIGGFLRKTQRTLLDTPWQIIQVMETGQPGEFEFRAFYLISVYCGDFYAKFQLLVVPIVPPFFFFRPRAR